MDAPRLLTIAFGLALGAAGATALARRPRMRRPPRWYRAYARLAQHDEATAREPELATVGGMYA